MNYMCCTMNIKEGLSYDDVLLVPQLSPVSTRSNVSLETNFVGGVSLDIPIVSAAMDTVTEHELATELSRIGGIGVIHRFLSPSEQAIEVEKVKEEGEQVAAAVGINEDYENRVNRLVESNVDALVVDVAHGHLTKNIEVVSELTSCYDVPVVAGNVATADAAHDLTNIAGADAIKVGIGPGAYCTTRTVTGVGVPQITAIDDVVSVVPDDIPVIADGGIKTSGDAAKALMAGADSVMLGTFFVGTDEAPSIHLEEKGIKVGRGMSSHEANEERTDENNGVDNYDVAEGESGGVEYVGKLTPHVKEFAQGIRSSISYCGGHTIAEARENAEFVKVTGNTKSRNYAHYDE